MSNINPRLQDVRISRVIINQWMRGEITLPMYVVMSLLYRFCDWKTGIVGHTSAGALVIASQRAFKETTIQKAMLALEKMGWITRQNTFGSTKWYAVKIHNFKRVSDAGKIVTLNPKPITGCSELDEYDLRGQCGEDNPEQCGESADNTSVNTSVKGSSVETTVNLALLLSAKLVGTLGTKWYVGKSADEAIADYPSKADLIDDLYGNPNRVPHYELWKKINILLAQTPAFEVETD